MVTDQRKHTERNLITNTDQVYKLSSEGVLRLVHIHHPYLGRDLEEGHTVSTVSKEG